jgi:hypothetical protein
VSQRPPKQITKVIPPAAPAPPGNIVRLIAGAGTIVQEGQAPFSAQDFVGSNHWYEVKGGQETIVYAGSERKDRGAGTVRVTTAGRLLGDFPTPTKSGPVRVASASGERLTLTSSSGASFIFDVASRSYVPQ